MRIAQKRKSKGVFRLFGKAYTKEETVVGWLFILPAIILCIIFVLTPMLISLSYAFTDANLLSLDNVNFNGFDNFIKLFNDPTAITALKNSLIFVVAVVPIQLFMALGLALLLNRQKKASTFLRWVFFSPVMLSLSVTALLWINLLNPDPSGMMNSLLGIFGIAPQTFLKDSKQAMAIIVFVSAWQGAGYQMLIFLSGLKNISAEVYEAAKIDGAGRTSTLFRITLPLIKNTFGFVLITMLIGAFKLIVQPMVMTGGGPVDATLTVSLYIYNQGVTFREVGYSSAIALVYTVIISIVALTLRRVFGEGKD